MTLQLARSKIVTSPIPHQLHWSILEKQNESGFMFNQRVFFLVPNEHCGYLSDPKTIPTAELISRPKAFVTLRDIRSIHANQKILTLKFVNDEYNGKKIEKSWNFKASTEELAKKWHDKINEQKQEDILRHTSPKLIEQEKQYQSQSKSKSNNSRYKSRSPKNKSKKFGFSKTVEVSQMPTERASRDMGISVEPKEEQRLQQISPFKIVQTRDMGTLMSQESRKQIKKDPSMHDANIGTQQIQEKLLQSKASNRISVEDRVMPVIQRSDSIKMKNNRSTPIGPKVEPFHLTQKTYHKAQTEIQQEQKEPSVVGKGVHTSQKQGHLTPSNQPSQPSITSSAQKLLYLDRTSKLIRQSSVRSRDKQNLRQSASQPQPEQQQFIKIQKQDHGMNQGEIKQSRKEDGQFYELYEIIEEPSPASKINRDKEGETDRIEGSEVREDNYKEQVQGYTFRHNQYTNLEHQEDTIPWMFRYLTEGPQLFSIFAQHCSTLMSTILHDLTKPAHQQQLPYQLQTSLKLYHFHDVQAKIATLSTIENPLSKHNDRVCCKDQLKMLQNQYNSFEILYEALEKDGCIRPTLVCLVELRGVLGLFKVVGRARKQQLKMREIQDELQLLEQRTKISHNFHINHHRYIVPLDGQHYQQFLTHKQHKQHNLNIFIIQDLEGYLPADLLTHPSSKLSVLRKELILSHADSPLINQVHSARLGEHSLGNKQLKNFAHNIAKSISLLARDLDSLEVYFLSSKEISDVMHQRGINMRYLGLLYEQVKNELQRGILMSEMAGRCVKALLRKTLQDAAIEDHTIMTQAQVKQRTMDLINCILGYSSETAALWKLLTAHSKNYFGVELHLPSIHKGHLLLSIIQNCHLEVQWGRISPTDVFRNNQILHGNNFRDVREKIKIYRGVHDETYGKVKSILEMPQSEEGFRQIVHLMDLQSRSIPPQMEPLTAQLLKYLSNFIDPTTTDYSHLPLHPSLPNSPPSRLTFDLALLHIRWLLRLNDQPTSLSSQFVTVATSYYGEYHPIFSELYTTFAEYHSQQGQHHQALTYGKSSLVNILALCGTDHRRTAECYYQLGGYYLQAGRAEQALTQLKKSLKIQQTKLKYTKNQSNSIALAAVLLKIAMVQLSINNLVESISYAQKSIVALQELSLEECEDLYVEALEFISKCYENRRDERQLRLLSQEVANKLGRITHRDNLEKMLRMYLYRQLIELNQRQADNYLSIIERLNPEPSRQNIQIAFTRLRDRLSQGSFQTHLLEYLNRLSAIQQYVSSSHVLQQWVTFDQIYQRQTVDDFLALTEQLILFLGETFLKDSLKQVL